MANKKYISCVKNNGLRACNMFVRVCAYVVILSILTKELLRGIDHVEEPVLVFLCVINIAHSGGHACHALVVD